MIKVFHTADLHIGMRFNSYPDHIKSLLQQARLDVINNMVQKANEEGCNIFVVAGDLFDRINGIDKNTISKTVSALEEFHGECVLVLPGNHDYDNGMVELWTRFNKDVRDKILYINEKKPYSLEDYGLDVTVYPAPCHAKHSAVNSIGWIKDEDVNKENINIGVGHGAIVGLSPDMDSNYYNMTIDELIGTPLDLWLLGHTHIPYPLKDNIINEKVYNPGTPEPDGLDCKHGGNAWIINIDKDKNISANRTTTGLYKFIDKEYEVKDRDDLDKIGEDFYKYNSKNIIARIKLNGRLEEDDFNYRQEVYKRIEESVAYLIIEDNNLGIKITKDKIYKEFSDGSFPQQLLLALSDDEDTLQLAYELIMEVKE